MNGIKVLGEDSSAAFTASVGPLTNVAPSVTVLALATSVALGPAFASDSARLDGEGQQELVRVWDKGSGIDNPFPITFRNEKVEQELRGLSKMSSAMQISFDQLRGEVEQIRSGMAVFAARLDSITEPANLPNVDVTDVNQAPNTSDLEAIGDWLDYVADMGLQSEVVEATATAFANSTDNFVRTAAIRALAVCNPDKAKPLIQSMMETEKDSFTLNILSSVYRSVNG